MSALNTVTKLFKEQAWAVIELDEGQYALYTELDSTEDDLVGYFSLAELYLEYMALVEVIDYDQRDACAHEIVSL